MYPVPQGNAKLRRGNRVSSAGTSESVSGICCLYLAAAFWLFFFFPKSQSSAEFLHAGSGECLELYLDELWFVHSKKPGKKGKKEKEKGGRRKKTCSKNKRKGKKNNHKENKTSKQTNKLTAWFQRKRKQKRKRKKNPDLKKKEIKNIKERKGDEKTHEQTKNLNLILKGLGENKTRGKKKKKKYYLILFPLELKEMVLDTVDQ